jgi:hypothetical protein
MAKRRQVRPFGIENAVTSILPHREGACCGLDP